MFGIELKSDYFLVNEIKRGNESILLTLYKQNYSSVKKFIQNNNGSLQEVQEVLNETLIIVWQTIAKADYLLNVKLSEFVLLTAKNQWYKQIKNKNKFKVVNLSPNDLQSRTDAMPLKYDPNIVCGFVHELDPESQKILMNYYYDGLDITIMADALGLENADALKLKKYQCLKNLENKVKTHFQDL